MQESLIRDFRNGSIPASAGIGLRSPHEPLFVEGNPTVAWLEMHSENVFRRGGRSDRALLKIRERYPLSLHGVGLSLGSADPLDHAHLDKLRDAVRRFEPGLVSEHVSWGAIDGKHVNDLLPLPMTRECLDHMVNRVDAVQSFLGRKLLLENVSRYFEYAESHMSEAEFFSELVRRSGCGVLLDINNLYVNERNHGASAMAFIEGIPAESVGEIHLAGHSIQSYDEHDIFVDTHDNAVCNEVWDLYVAAVGRLGKLPTLIEWDSNLPSLETLIREARSAQLILDESDAIAA